MPPAGLLLRFSGMWHLPEGAPRLLSFISDSAMYHPTPCFLSSYGSSSATSQGTNPTVPDLYSSAVSLGNPVPKFKSTDIQKHGFFPISVGVTGCSHLFFRMRPGWS